MNIIYIGSSSPLSLTPLKSLINSQYNVAAIAFDESLNSDFNVIAPGTIESFAFSHSIPCLKINNSYSSLIAQLDLHQVDVILVSCYARKIPPKILSLARKGSFNIHPSLLPKFRGPNPLFWQFREGIKNFGITLHRMTNDFDAGNIVAQEIVNLKDGIDINAATSLLADAASDLIINTLDNISNNNIIEFKQEETLSTYQSFPTQNDYSISTLWSVKRIYNFINAYKQFGASFSVDIDGLSYRLIDVISFQEKPFDGMNGKPMIQEDKDIKFSCKGGYMQCKVK